MSFHNFQTGNKPQVPPLTLPAQTPVPTTPSAEQPVPGALISGGTTVSTVSRHSDLAKIVAKYEASVAKLEKKFTKEFSREIELGNSQAAADLVRELTTQFPEEDAVAVILVKCDRICLDQFRDHDTLQIRKQIEESLRNYRSHVGPDQTQAASDYFYRKIYNDELTRFTADALEVGQSVRIETRRKSI